MPETIDAKGLACPQPVILAKKAIEKFGDIIVIVDNKAALENVKRLGNSKDCAINIEDVGDGSYKMHLSTKIKSGIVKDTATSSNVSEMTYPKVSIVIVFSENCMGRGNDELGALLAKAFIHTIVDIGDLPDSIIFYNTGVKLTVKDSEVIDDLKKLEELGVEILVCGTCTNYFEISDDVDVGIISNMYDIASKMSTAERLVMP